jgi:hypothetical protein
VLEFTAPDASGRLHRYDLTLHRGSEGQRLALKLSALLLEPLAEALGPVLLEGVGNLGKVVEDTGTKAGIFTRLLDSPDVLAAVDMPAVGRAAERALLGVDDATIYDVLRYTNRDGQPLVDARRMPTSHYDEAYAANYTELGRALWGAARANGFFPALGTSGSGSGAASSPAPGPPGRRA